MVAVDEARQHDLVAAADHGRVRIALAQVRVGTDGGDDAVLLQHGAVVDLLPGLAIQRLGDDGTAANEGGGHGGAPDLARTTCGVGLGQVVFGQAVAASASCSAKARSTSSRISSASCRRSSSASEENGSRGRGISTGTIVLMRPGRDVNTTTRSASATASSM